MATGFRKKAESYLVIANNVYIKEDKMLFDSLYPLSVGDEIPVKVYRAVAEILAFVYKLEAQMKAGKI